MSLEQMSTQDEKMLPEGMNGAHDVIRNWIFNEIRPFVKGKVLEIGSEGGDMAALFVKNELSLRISDPHRDNCQLLKNKFEGNPLIKGVHRIDLKRPDFQTRYKKYLGQFNIIMLINTQNKYYDNKIIWVNARSLLKDRGYLIALLPAKGALYEEANFDLKEWIYANKRSINEFGGKENRLIQCKFIIISRDSESLSSNTHLQQGITFFKMPDEPLEYRNGLSMLAIVKQKERILQS